MTPLRSAVSALEAVRDQHAQRRLLVAFSGGKDSIVCLKLALRVFGAGHVAAFHMRIVPGLHCVEEPARRICDALGVPLRTYADPDAIRALREGVYCVERKGIAGALPKYRDVERVALQDAECEWTALGWRKSDNYSRLFVLRAGLVGPPKGPQRVFPVGDWKDADILGALRAWKIQPVPKLCTREGARSSGVSLNPAVLSQIRRRFPDDYGRIKEVFPHVDAAVFRYEHLGAEPVPERDGGAGSPA